MKRISWLLIICLSVFLMICNFTSVDGTEPPQEMIEFASETEKTMDQYTECNTVGIKKTNIDSFAGYMNGEEAKDFSLLNIYEFCDTFDHNYSVKKIPIIVRTRYLL